MAEAKFVDHDTEMVVVAVDKYLDSGMMRVRAKEGEQETFRVVFSGDIIIKQ